MEAYVKSTPFENPTCNYWWVVDIFSGRVVSMGNSLEVACQVAAAYRAPRCAFCSCVAAHMGSRAGFKACEFHAHDAHDGHPRSLPSNPYPTCGQYRGVGEKAAALKAISPLLMHPGAKPLLLRLLLDSKKQQ